MRQGKHYQFENDMDKYIVERRRDIPPSRTLVHDFCQRCQIRTTQEVKVEGNTKTIHCLRCKNNREYELKEIRT
jgi:hypothetical protein